MQFTVLLKGSFYNHTELESSVRNKQMTVEHNKIL